MDTILQQDSNECFTTYSHDLRRFIRFKSSDENLIDDVMQDVFIKLHMTISRGKEINNLKSWLFRVAQNVLNDHYRAAKKNENVNIVASRSTIETDDYSHTPADCLRGIIAKLPFKYKKAVYFVDIKGLRQTEAAEQLDIALPTFKSHVQRGRKLVAQGYVECCDYKIKEDGTLEGEIKDWDECSVCH